MFRDPTSFESKMSNPEQAEIGSDDDNSLDPLEPVQITPPRASTLHENTNIISPMSTTRASRNQWRLSNFSLHKNMSNFKKKYYLLLRNARLKYDPTYLTVRYLLSRFNPMNDEFLPFLLFNGNFFVKTRNIMMSVFSIAIVGGILSIIFKQ